MDSTRSSLRFSSLLPMNSMRKSLKQNARIFFRSGAHCAHGVTRPTLVNKFMGSRRETLFRGILTLERAGCSAVELRIERSASAPEERHVCSSHRLSDLKPQRGGMTMRRPLKVPLLRS